MMTNETSYDSIVLTKGHMKVADSVQRKKGKNLIDQSLAVSSIVIKVGLIVEHPLNFAYRPTLTGRVIIDERLDKHSRAL